MESSLTVEFQHLMTQILTETESSRSGTDMSLFDLARPLLFKTDPERAHAMMIAALKLSPFRAKSPPRSLACRVAGIDFPSPVGLAAGFDKDAQVPDAMLGLGFGFVEVGTLTPLPQAGNPKPRLFRLVEDQGVINRMGFNNGGLEAAHARLARRRRHGIVGVNVGANKDTVDRVGDYVAGVTAMADVADYLTINISSPNTPGLRNLQDAGLLRELLDALTAARRPVDPPLFLKLAPDLDHAEIDAVAKVVVGRVDALIVGNTTLSRPALRAPGAGQAGGLSGAPLRDLAVQRLRDFRRATGGAVPLIAAGGINSTDEAYLRIRAGAALVQLYSALVFEGPGLARRIANGLAEHLARDGFATVAEATGVDAV
jgi:dihydroorotate dehydrogenase